MLVEHFDQPGNDLVGLFCLGIGRIQLLHLLDGEPQLFQPQNEFEFPDIFGGIHPYCTLKTPGRGHDPHLFVIPKRPRGQADGFGQIPDGYVLFALCVLHVTAIAFCGGNV